MKINQLKYTEEQIKLFGEYYKQGYSLKETSEKFNVNYHTLKQNLIRFGYRNPKKKLDHQRVEKICYFDSIDTPEKAYILGFLFSDGYISRTPYGISIGLALQSSDKYILEYIKQEWGIKNKISEYKNSVKLQTTDRYLYSRLLELGIYEDKFHKDFVIPNIKESLINSFILGYFDGDGCITIKSTGYVSISICCNSRMFLESVQSYLIQQNIFSRPITTEHRAKHPLYVLYITKRKDQNAFKDLIYRNSTIFLKRKYNKFLQIPR